MAWNELGEFENAVNDYREVIRLDPQETLALNSVAWILATCPDDAVRDGELAIDYATQACEISEWKSPNDLDTLAAACAEAGQFEEAVKWQTQAIELAENAGREDLADYQSRLELYQAGMPYRSPDRDAEESAP